MPKQRLPRAGDVHVSGPIEAKASAPTSTASGAAINMPKRHNQPSSQRRNQRPAPCTANARLLSALFNAQKAQPKNLIVRPGGPNGEDRVIFSKMLSSMATLQEFISFGAELKGLVDEEGHITLDPPYQLAGKTITVEAAMSQASRALSAGATLIQGAEVFQEVPTPHGPIDARSAISFSTFEPMQFSLVDFDADPDAELSVSPSPFHTAEVDLDAFQQYGVALRLTRRQFKDVPAERMAVQLLWPLIQGLGRALDAAFFDALGSLSLTPWSVGSAAAQGVPFESLRGVVGTGGTGATTMLGKLYAGLNDNDVPAELSPDTTDTFIGAFSRAAIVTNEDIKIIATRTDASGGLEIACWLGIQALIPDPSKFWAVA